MSMNVNAYAHINLDYLDLMSDGDVEMKKVMLEMLFDELPSEIKKMSVCLKEEDWDELRSVSHKMKSTLAFVGNEEMTMANKVLEQNAKNRENFDEMPSLLAVLENTHEAVIAELRIEHGRI